MAIHLKLGNNGRPWKWNLKPLYFKFITTTIETLTGVYDAVATPAGITLHVLNAVMCVTFLVYFRGERCYRRRVVLIKRQCKDGHRHMFPHWWWPYSKLMYRSTKRKEKF